MLIMLKGPRRANDEHPMSGGRLDGLNAIIKLNERPLPMQNQKVYLLAELTVLPERTGEGCTRRVEPRLHGTFRGCADTVFQARPG